MKQKTAWILYGGAAFLYFFVWRGIKGLKVAFNSINWVGGTSNSIILRLNILVKNTLFVGLTINNIKGELYCMGERIADINYNVNTTIAPRRITVIPIEFSAYFNETLQAIKNNIISGDIRTLSFSFRGSVEAAGKVVPITKTIYWEDLV